MSLQSIILAVFLTTSVYGGDSPADKANKLFKGFESGEFIKSPNLIVMGWEMTGPDGKMISRDTLIFQANQVALLGVDAFPVALKKIEHKNMYIRYIAATALRKISGEDPLWYSFGVPGEIFNGNSTWSDDAKVVWRAWYQKQSKKPNKS